VNARWSLPSCVTSVGDARVAVRHFLEEAGSTSDERETVALIASELVTNAVVHTKSAGVGPIEMAVSSFERRIRIEVWDHDPSPPAARAPGREALNGRGLAIVDGLASTWGWNPVSENGKRIWCDVPRSAGATPLAPGPALM
jgi:anti-sigma regulatory factor (Ser/Thr protein kinase)